MKDASRTWTARSAREADPYDPPQPRRRKRDAVLWDRILTVYTTNPSSHERWEGMRVVRIREANVFRELAMRQLRVRDRELYRAVCWVQQRYSQEFAAQMERSFACWQAGALKRTAPLARVRTLYRPHRPERSLAALYWTFLRATEFLTAEVAERQTR
jgi:hypothetical protein